jgi:phage gpG-like protein
VPPRQRAVSSAQGLKLDRNLVNFEFKPSVGIVAARIFTLGRDISSFKEPLTEAVRKVMIPSIQTNFNVGGRPTWEPLADYTLQRREEEGYGRGNEPLIRTGQLQFTMRSMSTWQITDKFATVRDLPAKVWYGKLQQQGYGSFGASVVAAGGDIKKAVASLGKGGDAKVVIPARPFVMIQEEDGRAIQVIFDKWITKQALKAGFF